MPSWVKSLFQSLTDANIEGKTNLDHKQQRNETKRNAPKMILIKQSQFGLLETVNYKAPKHQGSRHVCCNFRKVAQGINEQH